MCSEKKYHPGLNYIELANQFWQLNEVYMFNGNETRLYFFLVHLCNSYSWYNPFKQSLRQIQGKASMSVNTIKCSQKRLIKAGLINVRQGTSGNPRDIKNKTEYQLLIVSKKVSHTDIHLDTQSDSQPDTITKQKLKLNNTIYQFNFKRALIGIGIEPEVVDEWLNVRKTKRATNSEIAFSKIKSEIEKSGKTANECATIAVEKSWQGFESDWLNSNSAKKCKTLLKNGQILHDKEYRNPNSQKY